MRAGTGGRRERRGPAVKAIMLRRHGGPEVLEPAEVALPQTGAGEARVAIKAVGINRRDAFIRAGSYPRDLPLIPGIEGAGVIDEVGPGVTRWRVGERVAWYVPDRLGAYAEYQAVPADRLVALPDALSFEAAAAIFDHGLTAHYLTETTFPIRAGHRVLVHAAAGGVGSLLVQFAKRAGAIVYGTVSTPDKAAFIGTLGADAAILYRDVDFAAEILRLTDGEGVDAVYDSVGKDTVAGSVRALAKRGMLVLYGQSSGPVRTIDPALLADQGSVYFTRPHLLDHIDTAEKLTRRSGELFDVFLRGELRATIDRTYPLAEAAAAHRRIEDRARWGKVLLIP